MPCITLPDESQRKYEQPVSGREIAEDIGAGLARDAVGMRIDGILTDLAAIVSQDARIEIIAVGKKEKDLDPDALYLIRHSCAHVMAEAVQRIIPGVQLAYGPPVDNGFYYDMRLPEDRTLTSEDFDAIEREMAAIIEEDRPFTRFALPFSDGMQRLEEEANAYKIDNARRAEESGDSELSWYATGTPGDHWDDLCRGPHLPSTGRIGAFKVLSIASSYWRGDASSDRLTRLYGTAFAHEEHLATHLEHLEEARKRDHRVIGRALELFHIDPDVGQGLILWTPAGAVVRQQLQDFISEELARQDYSQVFTPHIGKIELYKVSGHFPFYQDSQYPPLLKGSFLNALAEEGCTCSDLANRMQEGEIDGYLLKPMNCPHHIKIYASRAHSYRDLPVRLAEFGTVYRWEQSGEIGGMTRVRGFTQDDAHIFCTEEQIAGELRGCLALVRTIFEVLGITDFRVRVGLRDEDESRYVGTRDNWDRAEEACLEAAETLGVSFSRERGEAAFYGPKIDFVVRDVLEREWQLGTIQVDYNLPERFDLRYTGADNQQHRPVMIHRAPFGSLERFCGLLIEHFAGAFPAWLAPVQVRILPISEKSDAYGQAVLETLKEAGLRVRIDLSNERLQAKIKAASLVKIPFLLIVGPRDEADGTVSIRRQGIRKNLGSLDLDTFTAALVREVASRGADDLIATHFPGIEDDVTQDTPT